jgi:hypothetical protein
LRGSDHRGIETLLRTWMEDTLAKLSRKSDTAAAIRYASSRWQALTRYVDDGQLEIDNNPAERALRVVALGRKNHLFCGSNAGGERAAAIYSLLGSAKLNRLDPELYLHQVLKRIADQPISRITELLPWTSPSPRHGTLLNNTPLGADSNGLRFGNQCWSSFREWVLAFAVSARIGCFPTDALWGFRDIDRGSAFLNREDLATFDPVTWSGLFAFSRSIQNQT